MTDDKRAVWEDRARLPSQRLVSRGHTLLRRGKEASRPPLWPLSRLVGRQPLWC